MKFGPVAPDDALGATAVHSIRKDGLVLKKGTVIGAKDVAALESGGRRRNRRGAARGRRRVARTRPPPRSRRRWRARASRVDRAFTGRANLFAENAGVLVVERDAVDDINRIDEAITFATLPAYKPVVAGEMIATVKIIPFAVAGRMLARARWRLREKRSRSFASRPIVFGKSASSRRCCRDLPPKVVEQDRCGSPPSGSRRRVRPSSPSGACRMSRRRVAKAVDEVLGAGAELVIVFGASAIADRRDVIPAAIEAVGGRIEHFGMPVDPGNLMLIGTARGRPVLGAPGCARSPKENGFDWVLMRLARRACRCRGPTSPAWASAAC